MTGFGMKLWDDLSFGAIWMSAAMDLDHPEAEAGEEASQLCGRRDGAGVEAQSGARPAIDGACRRAGAQQERDDDAARDAAQGKQDQADLCSCEVEQGRTRSAARGTPPSACWDPRKTSTSTIWARKAIRRCARLGFIDTGLPDPSTAVPEEQRFRRRRISIPPTSASCARACCRPRSPLPISTARSATIPASCC